MSQESVVEKPKQLSPLLPPIDENNWRQELYELNNRLEHAATESQAKDAAAEELKVHNDAIRGIEKEIDSVKGLLKDSAEYLTGFDRKRISDKIEGLEDKLKTANARRERSIRLSGACVRDAKELDKGRSRWKELKKRADSIERARSVAKHGVTTRGLWD